MTLRAAIVLLAFFCTTMSIAREQGNSISTTASDNSKSQNDQSRNDQPRNDESQALRDDLTRMRAVVQQMETNLAFVDTTQSPLKHQFQLEIDMWRTLINQMERRLQPQKRSNQVR